jgi:K+-sensing histidine kinase KdpD
MLTRWGTRLERVVPYALAALAVVALTLVLVAVARALGVERVDTYPLIYVLLIGAIAWRYGRGPGLLATLLANYFFVAPGYQLGVHSVGDAVSLGTAGVAALAVVHVLHLNRSLTGALEARGAHQSSRLTLLQEIGPEIVQHLDPDQILRAVAEQTRRVIDYHHFRLYRWNEAAERLVLLGSVAREPPYTNIDWKQAAPEVPLGQGLTGLAASSRQALLVLDASQDPRVVYVAGAVRIPESVLSVPMLTAGRLFGVLALARRGAHSLTAEDQRLMEAIAAQTALALANAEQYALAERTIQALAAMEELEDETVNPEQELHARIAQRLGELAQAELTSMRVRRGDGRYRLVAPREEGSEVAGIQPALPPEEVAWLADMRLPYHVGATQTDPNLPPWAREAAARAGIHTSVFLPLRAGNQLLAFVGLHWRSAHPIAREQLQRLQFVAAQGAIALETRRVLEDERERARQLADLDRVRREFMQIASHELRTPLSVIRGYASLLQDGSLGKLPDPAMAGVRMLDQKADEMSAQVERMLSLARLEEGRATYRKVVADLQPLVRSAVARVEPQVELRSGTVAIDLPADPLSVSIDAHWLGMALDNLLQNAVKFTVEPPRIEVSARQTDGLVELVIRDHGVGIAAEAMPRLFEKFYRVEDAAVGTVNGTGIGLYLARQVVEAHGGTIVVDSQVGTGTAFTIRLPLQT